MIFRYPGNHPSYLVAFCTQPAGMLPVIDPATQRAEYEHKWQNLESIASAAASTDAAAVATTDDIVGPVAPAGAAGGAIRWADVPWPLPDAALHQADLLKDVLLHGVKGPADIKRRLRTEIMR